MKGFIVKIVLSLILLTYCDFWRLQCLKSKRSYEFLDFELMDNITITDLDLKGLECPMPLLKTKRALKELPSGGVLRVHTTDPGSVKDFEVFALHSRHELLEFNEEAGVYCFLLRKN